MSALDQSTIGAVAGAAAVSASFAGTAGVSASIGISLARNTILSSIDAYVTAVPTFTATSLAVTAVDRASIQAASVAAAIAIAAGGTAGISLAGGGATAENIIGVHTDASIVDSTLGTNANKFGDVTVTASDISSIDAVVGAAAVAAAGGGAAGVGIAIGVALADNQINDGAGGTGEVQAFIAGSSITSSGAVHLNATSGETIDAVVVAAAAALAGGGAAGVAASGAGVDTSNTIAVATRAYIDGGGTATIAITTAPRTLATGTLVTVADGYDPAKGVVGHTYQYKGSGAVDITHANYLDTSTWTDLGTLAPNYDTSLQDVSTKYEVLATGDEVLIAAGYHSSKGTAGHIYQYTGSSTDPIDLASTNYKTGPWTDLGAVKYASQPASGTTTNSQQLTQGDIVQVTQGHDPAKGTVNDLYAFKGTTGTTLDLASANFADGTMWTHLGVPKFDTTPVATKFATVSAGDEVLVAQGYDPSKGVVGHYYEYTGVQASLDSASTNYTAGPWLDLGGVKYLAQGVTPNRQLLTNGDIVQVSPGYNELWGSQAISTPTRGRPGQPSISRPRTTRIRRPGPISARQRRQEPRPTASSSTRATSSRSRRATTRRRGSRATSMPTREPAEPRSISPASITPTRPSGPISACRNSPRRAAGSPPTARSSTMATSSRSCRATIR